MQTLFFISTSLALNIHQQQIKRFGGILVVRDMALLESALHAPQHTWHYTQDIFQTAAQYCYSISNNHPFLDGNKRVATACMLVFLVANKKQPVMSNAQLYDWVINITTNQCSCKELANFLSNHCQ